MWQQFVSKVNFECTSVGLTHAHPIICKHAVCLFQAYLEEIFYSIQNALTTTWTRDYAI